MTGLQQPSTVCRYMPHMPKGVLKDVPGLQDAATSKLSRVRRQALSQLQESLQELQLCVQTLRCGPEPAMKCLQATRMWHNLAGLVQRPGRGLFELLSGLQRLG